MASRRCRTGASRKPLRRARRARLPELGADCPDALEVFIRPARIEQAFNYGLERVRFVAPVKAGARVRNRIALLSIEERGPEHLLLRTENRIEIEAEGKPAVLAVALVLVARGNTKRA
jgi:acyl dehydratase